MRLVDLDTDVLVAGEWPGFAPTISALGMAPEWCWCRTGPGWAGIRRAEVVHVVGAKMRKGQPGWRDSGLIEELKIEDAVHNPQRSFEMWDLLLYDKVMSEPNITLLLETAIYAAEMKDDSVQRVMARCDKSEHLYRIRAKMFCDCTGDSRLGIETGALYRVGRETRSEFNETLAPEKADTETLGSSVLFTSRLYRMPMPFTPPKWAQSDESSSWRIGRPLPGNTATGGSNGAAIWIMSGQRKNPLPGCCQSFWVWDFSRIAKGIGRAKYYAMDWIGMMPGKRGAAG